jgi:large conductance mechanosensitive channel
LFVVVKEGATAGPHASLVDAQAAGAVSINYGMFINTIISFLIIAAAIFIVVKMVNRMKREEEAAPAEPTTKSCEHCDTEIPIKAVRCPN